MSALNRAGFDANNEEHIFVCCGDLLDRGGFPSKCLDFVNSLPDNRKILIRGNHEELAISAIRRGYFGTHDWHNGTAETIQWLSEYATDPYAAPEEDVIESFSKNPKWIKYYNSTVFYREVGNYIFTHAWIPFGGTIDYPVYESNWKEKSFHDAIWVNGMEMWHRGVRVPGKTVVCGHWRTIWGNIELHNMDPRSSVNQLCATFKDEGIICLDSSVPSSHFINVEVIEIDDDLLYI
jgi:hypothetical protein